MQDVATTKAEAPTTSSPVRTKVSITAIILTFNEEIHIKRCIGRVAPLAERVVVVDSFSTDRTVEIAKGLGAEVYQRAFKHQADQFQWALENCDVRTDWALRLDADEYLEEGLTAEIADRLNSLPAVVTGIEMRRKFFFMGRWIRHGGYYPTVLIRLWRTGAGYVEQRWMDEHVVLTRGVSQLFKAGDLVDENLAGIDAWLTKHNRYATRQMVDFINREYGLFAADGGLERQAHAQARWKRFLRDRVFARAPLYVRSVLYFLYRYVLRAGFLDGRQGFVFHSLHGFAYFLLIDAKIDEARGFIRKQGIEAFKQHLRTHHKIAL
jgi:glycosyltransferase involved in cell wall biosynthesis